MRLVSIPANPVPDDVVTGVLKTPDNIELRFARWAPPPGRKGTVCIFHGRTEFIEKYFETVRELRSRGFAVATIDFRGQGLSQRELPDPRKGHVDHFADYEIDLETVMKEIVLPDCPPPYYALGHSTGSAVLLRIGAKGHRWFDRMVLCTPLLELSKPTFPRYSEPVVRFLKIFGFGHAYIPGGNGTVIAAKPFVGNILTSDPVRYARTVAVLEAEPALGIGSPTVGWAYAAFEAMRQFDNPAYTAKIHQPVLMIAAGRDMIVSTPKIESYATRLRAGSHLIIAGAKHEIMMEQDRYRAQFWAAFDAFVPGTPLY
jgi:lysophospholipase